MPNNSLDTPDLGELRRLLAAATPGPWRASIGMFGSGALTAERPSLMLAEVRPDGNRPGKRDSIYAERHEDAELVRAILNALPALLDVEAGGLDAAWKAAEAALPEGWWLQVDCGDGIGVPYPNEKYRVQAGQPQWSKEYRRVETFGPTPTAALQALAAVLREQPEKEPAGG